MNRATIRKWAALAAMAAIGWSTGAWGHYTSGVEQVGERTAAFLASPFVAAFDPAPLRYRMEPVLYPSGLGPGLCRWQRFILNGAGQPLLDPGGNPLKESVVGPCDHPPSY